MNYSWEIIKIIFYLILVLGIIYLLANFLKKKVFQPTGGQYMETIEQLYLGPNKSLKLVKVRENILLLGVTDEKIELLKEWPKSEFPLDLKANNNDHRPDFAHYLKDFIGKYRRDQNE